MLSNQAELAIINMRLCLESAERARRKIAKRKEEVRTVTSAEYIRAKRKTFDSLDRTVERVVDKDHLAKNYTDDEQLYRGLAIMYASVAQAELALAKALHEQTSNSLRNVGASRT